MQRGCSAKFRLQNSLVHDSKGRTVSNLSDPIHSMCNIATQEGSNATKEWNEKRKDSRESSTKKKSKSRKERRARAHEKHGRTVKARPEKWSHRVHHRQY